MILIAFRVETDGIRGARTRRLLDGSCMESASVSVSGGESEVDGGDGDDGRVWDGDGQMSGCVAWLGVEFGGWKVRLRGFDAIHNVGLA